LFAVYGLGSTGVTRVEGESFNKYSSKRIALLKEMAAVWAAV
jgi:hypothetical protein